MVSENDGRMDIGTVRKSSFIGHPLEVLGDTYGVFELLMDTSKIKPILSGMLCSQEYWQQKSRLPVVLSTFPFSTLAREISSSCPSTPLYQIGNVERMVVGDSRHAMNLGDQLAFEIFSTVMRISDMDIFLLGASNLYISDRKGFQRDFTDVFWSSFISSLLIRNDRIRLLVLSRGGLRYVDDLLTGYIVARLRIEVSDQSLMTRLIYL
ncbi:hypothetical protein [Thermoplasma sp.]|uniref:hypothetical protein n=1 Tax=Thermoplasma sp. TaxID=1973142 RepID=UPI00126EC7D8|nr:hypothetical protein [Thermoplasma sp.]KAA8923430.1 MAG: hypothetical protein F6Q11_00285 [Thermoplasma sp.]